MHGDYKYGAQLEAEELAWALGVEDFYSLPQDVQEGLYWEGLRRYWERRADIE